MDEKDEGDDECQVRGWCMKYSLNGKGKKLHTIAPTLSPKRKSGRTDKMEFRPVTTSVSNHTGKSEGWEGMEVRQ
jgi:hypothetical protein